MSHQTLKQLFPEMHPSQRIRLGQELTDILDVRIEPKIEEDGNKVRLYHEKCYDTIVLTAAKLFGNGI
jgi:hypothetical protein